MDDWATSSPWAETTNDDDDFADFQSSPPPTSNGEKGVTTTNGGGVALEGGVVNGFTPFKVNKGSFTNGWEFDDHGASHTHHADIRGGEGWKVEEEEAAATNGNGNGNAVTHPSEQDEDKLKPTRTNWTYKNEWAKSEESLAPSDTSNVWNKPDDWGKPETNPPEAEEQKVQEAIDAEVINIEVQPVPSIPSPVVHATESTEEPTEAPMEAQTDGIKHEDKVEPVTQEAENLPLPVLVEPENLSLTVPELAPSRSTSPISMGSDFGDFEDEDKTATIDEEPPVPSAPAPPPFDIRNIDVDNFAIGNLGALNALYETKSPQIPASDASEIISTTSQRKAWYKLIRKESARNSIQGEDILRVRWTGSETQKKVHEIVKRWISEDRTGGRTILGRNASGAGMFDWNSTSPRSSAMSPTRSSFPPPKTRFEPAKRMSMGIASPSSPRSPSFGWSSTQSARRPSFGWSSESASINSKASITSPKLPSPPAATNPAGNSAFSPIISQRQQNSLSRHAASSSVDIPRHKPTPSTSRPTSMFIESSSTSLFGELSIVGMRALPTRASVSSKPHSATPSMDLSIFDDPPPKPVETPADSSFDDDFGDFEGPEFQAAPPPPQVASVSAPIAPPSYAQAAPQPSQPKPSALATIESTIPTSQKPRPQILKSMQPVDIISQPPVRTSLEIATKSNQFDPVMTQPPKTTTVETVVAQTTTDPWGSFDIFDAPKQVQTAAPQPAPLRTPKTPLGRPSLPPLSNRSNGKSQVKTPALPILSPPIITHNESAIADDEFDDWGEMVSTPSIDQKKVEWPASQAPKLSVSSEPAPTVRRRSWTLDMFEAPSAENITSANPKDILPTPKPPPTKRTPSPISIQKSNNMPTIPGTPSPGANSLFSPNTLVPSRASTPVIATYPPSVNDSQDVIRQNSPAPRNGSVSSLNSMNSLSVRKDEIVNKRYSTPILPTQQFVQPAPPKPTASPQPNISSPLASEWGDMDFGAFEDATPKVVETKPTPVRGLGVKGVGHRPTASMGNIGAQTPPAGQSKHVSRGSVTMSPIVGKKDEDSVFSEIIDLLPDLSYMLK